MLRGLFAAVCAAAFAGGARADGDGGTHYEITGYIWGSSLAAKVDTPQGEVRGEIYGGARYWSIDPKFQISTSGPVQGARTFRIGERSEWVDPVVGLRFAADLSSAVVLGVAGDVGGFNIGNYCSDFTWEQVTTLSWRFGESFSTHFGYKLLDYHRDARGTNQRMQMRGPFIALSYGL
jgi:hypothetical protein